jgi:hypothetical protein
MKYRVNSENNNKKIITSDEHKPFSQVSGVTYHGIDEDDGTYHGRFKQK